MADRAFPLRVRIADLVRIIRWRCGNELPDDDAGREYLQIMVDHFHQLPDGVTRARTYGEVWAPWLRPGDLDTMIDAAARASRFYSGPELGRAINLTDSERTELAITTIAPIDVSDAELAERRRQRKAARERERRRRQRAARSKALLARRNALDARGAVVLQALQLERRWFSVGELSALTRMAFKDARGRPVAEESVPRLLRRVLDDLATQSLVTERTAFTKTGLPVRMVRLFDAPAERSDTASVLADTRTMP
ncbi:MAG TPA: hypothetical protein VHD14_00555 [Pseudolabrys sp.]|nr:hypothetical protein [Pseudolabrys sp.]